VGYALLTLGYQRLSRWWLADWHERRDWEPWMLVNLVLACQAVGRFAQAATVAHEGHTAIRRALRGGAATELSLRYEVLVASEAAFAAPAEDALARLERIEPTALIPSEAFRLDLAKAVATARAGGQGAFGRSRTRLAAAVRASPQFHRIPWLRRCHRRAVFAIGREFGILGRLWGMGAATSWFWR
jgi:hypothetical protein